MGKFATSLLVVTSSWYGLSQGYDINKSFEHYPRQPTQVAHDDPAPKPTDAPSADRILEEREEPQVTSHPICYAFQNPREGSGGCRCTEEAGITTRPFMDNDSDVCGYGYTTVTVQPEPEKTPEPEPEPEPEDIDNGRPPQKTGDTRRCKFGASLWSESNCDIVDDTCSYDNSGFESYLTYYTADDPTKGDLSESADLWRDDRRKPWEPGAWSHPYNTVGIQESIEFKWNPKDGTCWCEIDHVLKADGYSLDSIDGDQVPDSRRHDDQCICEFLCHLTPS